MPIKNKNVNESKFLAVSHEIEERIARGFYVSSQKLPSEYALALEFDVSRLTVRRALQDLINKQIVIKKKGTGTYIIERPKIQSGGMGLKSFSEVATAMGIAGQTKLINCHNLYEVPEKISQALHTNRDLVELKRLRLLDDEPMTLEKLYFSQNLIKGTTEKELLGSLFSIIEEKVEIGYSHQEIEAILSTEKLSDLLGIPVNSPVFRVSSIVFSLDARPILYDISYYRADRYSFKNTLIRK